jgi:hypothetical protein
MRRAGFALASLLIAVLLLGGPDRGGVLAAPGQTLIVTGSRVNVRYGPSADAKVRMKITRDQLVRELERQGDWVRAEIVGAGASGWISSSLLAVPSADRLARPRQGAPEPPRAGMPEPKPSAAPGAASAGPAPAAPIPPATGKPQPSGSSGGHASTAPAPPTAASSTAEPAATAPSPGESAPQSGASEQAAIAPATGPAETTDPPELARFRDSVDYLNSRSKSADGGDLFERVEEVGDGVVRVGATKAWASIPPASQQSYANALVDRWAAARGYSGPAIVQIMDPDGKLLLESKKP